MNLHIDIKHSMIDRRGGMLGRSVVSQRGFWMRRLVCPETPTSYLTETSAVHYVIVSLKFFHFAVEI